VQYYEFDQEKLERDLKQILAEISRKAKLLGRDERRSIATATPGVKPTSQVSTIVNKAASQVSTIGPLVTKESSRVTMMPKPASVTGAVAALGSTPEAAPVSGKWYRLDALKK
jgi:hypothetical protein